MDFDGRIVLVTGSSRGIGRAVAEQLATGGARVAVHFNSDRSAAQKCLAGLAGTGHQIFQADLSAAPACHRLVDEVVDVMGDLHILVNNAGIYEHHPVLDVDQEQWESAWQRTIATNLLGPANLMFAAARHMAGRGGGRIVNVSSRGAFRGEPDAPAYGASKAGLNAASQSLAQALAPHGVFVGVVAPGWVDTDMAAEHLAGPGGEAVRAQSPLNRVARPEEIARAVAFLASDGVEFLTGCIVDANGASYLRS